MLSSSPTTALPTSSAPPPTGQAVNSDPRQVTMETYWREVQSIEEERDGEEAEDEEEEEEERKSMDEVELEEVWLTEAGLSSLVTGSSSLEQEVLPSAEALLSTLTQQQVATVKRRLDNYNETLKKTNRQPIRDVRDIFTETDDESADRCPSPSSQSAESLPSRYHITTKTIRRSTQKVRATLPTFILEDQVPEHQSPPTDAHCPVETHSPSVSCFRRADWLLRDSPYSEGVAEHKKGGSCWDCHHFHGDDNSDLPFGPVSQCLTSLDDLSSADLTRIGFISHIELSTFLLTLGFQTKRTRPPRCRTRDSGVFGVPLKTLLENDRKKFPGVKVPIVFQKLLCVLEQTGLQTEGILRVPGSAARLKHLRKELDRCSGSGFDWSEVRQVDAAGLLKLFIRELPTALLTHTHLNTYRTLLGLSSLVHQVQALQLLTLLLPEEHRDTLRALLDFLCKVVSHQDQNRMSLWNVSMVMAPNLFAHRTHRNKRSCAKQQEMEEAVGGAHLVQLMIVHKDLLWTVPSFLLAQVRQMNQVSNQRQGGLARTKRRLLRRKNENHDRDQVSSESTPLYTPRFLWRYNLTDRREPRTSLPGSGVRTVLTSVCLKLEETSVSAAFIQIASYWMFTGSILTVIG
ncbi:rho GTPase-activating protein 28 isoform X2 [Sphaeramia orbicularis]|uniref:rho GTPase-activating protein 28 isoform X2 n=1 Tax=Sphaeramia orbicularis TaxID=375764 RepID=UPI00117D3DAD|nr:rho GTPase-activating protein 18-like isoform X2 [Sphaeramia orbicularis]